MDEGFMMGGKLQRGKCPKTLMDLFRAMPSWGLYSTGQGGGGKVHRALKICHAIDNLTAAERNIFSARRHLVALKHTQNIGPWLYSTGNRTLNGQMRCTKGLIEKLVFLLQKELPFDWVVECPKNDTQPMRQCLVHYQPPAEEETAGEEAAEALKGLVKAAELAKAQAALAVKKSAAAAVAAASDPSEEAQAALEQAQAEMTAAVELSKRAVEAVREQEAAIKAMDEAKLLEIKAKVSKPVEEVEGAEGEGGEE